MANFRYVVVTGENKQLQGTIGAPDEKSARSELNELGFSVISIEEIGEEAPSGEAQIPVWEFSAIDKNNKQVAGTIQAEDRYSAYVRLITEYEFDVESIVDKNLPEDQKEKVRKQGVYDLAEQYSEQVTEQVKETADEKDLKEFERKQEILQRQINFVLDKVKEMLDKYESDMQPEVKAKIRNKVEKILRIKNSTNLDYVRKSTEELLKLLQKEELFLHKEAHVNDRTKMVVEAKSMAMQLKSGKKKKSINLMDEIHRWRQEKILKNENPNALESFLDFLAKLFLGIHLENEKIREIKNEISSTNEQLKQYLRLYFEATDPQYKAQTKSGIAKLWNKRKLLKKQLKQARKESKTARKQSGEATPMERFADELTSISGWLLAFYLIYYFVSLYATTKEFGLQEIPGLFYVYRSEFLKYFLSTLFLLYAGLAIKKIFFPKNDTAGLVITPIFLVSIFLIYFNF